MLRYGAKFLIGSIPVVIVWWLLSFCIPAISGMEAPLDRLYFTLGCCAVAAFFCLMMGVEAVAHDRLFSPAVNPLAGFESKRIRVNKQYLQNTLEQFVLFAAAILAYSRLTTNGNDLRVVVGFTGAWILSRFIFWIAYHRNPLDRIYGLVGMAINIAVLAYTSYIFIRDHFGFVAAVFAGFAFFAIESVLTFYSWKKAKL